MSVEKLEVTPKLESVDILKYRGGLELLTSDKLENWLENPRKIKYYYIPNRSTAATIGATIAHNMNIPVIFTHDWKDLPYDSIKEKWDIVLDVKSYTEKEELTLDKVRNILEENSIDKNFSNEELILISKNSNLLDLLSLCRKKAIRPETVGIDPWYGMKSEDPDMIKVAELLWFNFIWPSSEAVALIWDKLSANKLAQNTKITPVPNTWELSLENVDEKLWNFINKYKGREIVLKASDWGGWSGQYKVDLSKEWWSDELIKEAKKWLEKWVKFDANLWIQESRHIEMQVIIDWNGKIVFGTPRNCTSQRAKQKIIEETAILTEEQITFLENSVTDFFKQVEKNLWYPYKWPATFEMLQDVVSWDFYFLEVNTRKQVEILVTEHQTGKNYIESSIKIAEWYILKDDDETNNIWDKHVIEARINLESTLSPKMIKVIKKNWEDKVAKPEWWKVEIYFDSKEEWVYLYFDKRVLKEGEQISDYDSMVGQLVVEWKNRKDAIFKLKRLLKQLEILGLPTNKQLCYDILDSEEFINDTHNSKTPTVKKYIEKEHKKMARKEKMDKFKKWMKNIYNWVKKALPDSENKVLNFIPEKTISLNKIDINLESVLNWNLIDWVFSEYNWNWYNLMFESEDKIHEFRWYLQWIWIDIDNIKNYLYLK